MSNFKNSVTNYIQSGGYKISKKKIDKIDYTLKNEVSELYSISELIRQHAGYRKINEKTVLSALKMKYTDTEYNSYLDSFPKNDYSLFGFTRTQTGGNLISKNKISKFVQEKFPNNKLTKSGLDVITSVVNKNIKTQLFE